MLLDLIFKFYTLVKVRFIAFVFAVKTLSFIGKQ